MYSFGSSGGLRARRFSLKSTLSHAILQGASFIAYAQPALQATLFAYRTLFRFRYADPRMSNKTRIAGVVSRPLVRSAGRSFHNGCGTCA